MCRFVLYLGPPLTLASLITEPANSLINQSLHARELTDPTNGDGFGVAWYVPRLSAEPGVFRAVTPAWNNPNLLSLARVTRSGCVLAHVRATTVGTAATELNCHPFTHGRHALMHNGDLDGFETVRRRFVGDLSDEAFRIIRGNTDSEHLFARFLDERRHARAGADSAEAMAEALEATIRYAIGLARDAKVEKSGTYLNIAVSDGRCAAACRFSTAGENDSLSLYVHRGRRYVCEGGLCRMMEPERGKGAVLISSERLSEDPGWEAVPHNHLVLVREDRTVRVRPVEAA